MQLLLGHIKVDSTVRYQGVELEDALSIAKRIDLKAMSANDACRCRFRGDGRTSNGESALRAQPVNWNFVLHMLAE